jgi:hypothetical protein
MAVDFLKKLVDLVRPKTSSTGGAGGNGNNDDNGGGDDSAPCLICAQWYPVRVMHARTRVVKESDADEDMPAGSIETVYLCYRHVADYDNDPY